MASGGAAPLPPADATPPASWRGRRGSRPLLKHRWQRDWAAQPLEQVAVQDQWRHLRVVWLGLVALALMAALAFYLIQKPVLTPVIILTEPAEAPYRWPLTPNAWSREDVRGWAELDGQTLDLADLSGACLTRDELRASLARALPQVARRHSAAEALVLYVNLHGAVDGAGQPCLVLPGSDPLRSESWLPVAELLALVKSAGLPDELHKLVVLDCARERTNWQLGLLENTFAESLADVVAAAEVPRLAVLASARPGQIAWTSADLSSPVLGHFLRRGLAGAADRADSGGNDNRRVELGELARYVEEHVDGWVRANRADRQQPWLIPATAPSCRVAWSTSDRWQRRNLDAPPRERPRPTVPAANLGSLWQKHEELRGQRPWRDNPQAWARLESELVWLERASGAGRAYEATAVDLYSRLSKQLESSLKRLGSAAQAEPSYRRRDLFSGRRTRLPEGLTVHSGPLAERFGVVPAAELAQYRTQWEALGRNPTRQAARELLARPPVHPQWSETRWLALLESWSTDEVWQPGPLLGQALAVRLRGEQLAAPDDPRVVPWIRPWLDQADHQRRHGEDLLLVGTSEALTEAAAAWNEAQASLDQAQRWAEQAAEAWATSDAIAAQLPWLAQWFSAALPPEQPSDPIDERINRVLLPLIEQVRNLEQLLAAGPPAADLAPGAAPEFSDSAREVAAGWDELQAMYQAEVDNLAKLRQPDPHLLRALADLLATPLIPARRREELLRLEALITNQTHRESTRAKAQSKPPAATGSVSHLERLTARWNRHPALAWVETLDALTPTPTPVAPVAADEQAAGNLSEPLTTVEAAPSDEAAPTAEADAAVTPPAAAETQSPARQAARWGDELRRRLAQTPLTIRRLAEAAPPADAPLPTDAPSARPRYTLAGWHAADRLSRATAAWAAGSLDVDPTKRLRRLELEQLLAWHAQRTLDDFLGPLGEDPQPFFAAAAGDYLAGAREMFDPVREVLDELAWLEGLASRRRQAALDGLTAAAADLLVIERIDPVEASLELRLRGDIPADALPEGAPAVFFRDGAGRIPGTSRLAPRPATQPAQLDYALPAADLAERGPVLEVVALWRGQAFRNTAVLRAGGGRRVDFAPPAQAPARITLAGGGRQRASVMILLDCSQSMNEPTRVEEPQGPQEVPRLDAAKTALANLLGALADEGRDRVGIRFFGHRIGWDLDNPERMLPQTTYGRPIPSGLVPSEDVERVLPLGRFDELAAGGVDALLPTVKPWGESPLYLALVDSLADFATESPDFERQIVVITDGLNNQFNSPNPQTLADVLAALEGSGVRVHVVGFEIAADEAPQAAEEFTQIARQTDGSFVPVDNATSLVRTLNDLLGPRPFRVEDLSGRTLAQAAAGTTVEVRPRPGRAEGYVVAVEDIREPLKLSGGERVELAVARSGRYLETPLYEAGNPQFLPLRDSTPGKAPEVWLGVHRPLNRGTGIEFEFSFQSLEERFLPRPAEVWLEIAPRGPLGKLPGGPFVYYDLNFAGDAPVPLLRWEAAPWPREATQAEIRVWCLPEPVAPDWEVTLDEATRDATPLANRELPGLPGVSYRVQVRAGAKLGDPLWVTVVERHAADSPGLGAVKVALQPTAARVTHVFDEANRLVIHGFAYPASRVQDVAEHRLQFTRRETLVAGAWQLAQPAVVDVSAGGDVIPLEAPGR